MPDSISSGSSDTGSESGWIDAENEVEDAPTIVSLLDDETFDNAVSMVDYCREKGFDFLATRDRLKLDFYGCIKLINFVRQHVKQGLDLPKQISKEDLEDDKYLKPVLNDDAFIICLDDLPDAAAADATPASTTGDADDLRIKNEELQAELDRLVRQFADYRLAVQQTLDQRWGEDDAAGASASAGAGAGALRADGSAASSSSADPKAQGSGVQETKDDSKYYWESYAHNEIHEIMLKDTVRTEAYRDFIYNNKDLFRDKVVMDIGCGTGILSMFCAKAGAKLVIAVDNSDIIDKARENVFNNKLQSTITCLKGKVEEVTLPVDQVDIIVSEWMGYCLLYEAMLPSVLWARDRYLKPDGLLVPSHTSMWIGPFADADWVDDHVTFWRDVYGFDMRAMQEGICLDAHIEVVPASSVAGEPAMFRMLDLHKCSPADLVFDVPYRCTASRDAARLDGFVVWFDTFFARDRSPAAAVDPPHATALAWSDGGRRADRVAFTTGPFGKPTHWKQGVLPIKQDAPVVKLVQGQPVEGTVSFSIPKDHPRGLVLKVTWAGEGGKVEEQSWEC